MSSYPYISGQGPLVAAFAQLRNNFPAKVDAGYLQRFNIAPANESYVISILRFLGLIDEAGNRAESKTDYFYGSDESFKSGLDGALRSAYSQLFSEMGEGALGAERSDLTHWFRAADKTSDLVGQRQASTFQTLSALAGHGDAPTARSNASRRTAAPTTGPAKRTTPAKKAPAKKAALSPPSEDDKAPESTVKAKLGYEVGLTVRVEVNLPPAGDAETYDAIFASIKKHLMS